MHVGLNRRSPANDSTLKSPLKFRPKPINFVARRGFRISSITRSRPIAYDKIDDFAADSKAT